MISVALGKGKNSSKHIATRRGGYQGPSPKYNPPLPAWAQEVKVQNEARLAAKKRS